MGYSTVSLEAALSAEEAVLSEADSLLAEEVELPQAASKAAALTTPAVRRKLRREIFLIVPSKNRTSFQIT